MKTTFQNRKPFMRSVGLLVCLASILGCAAPEKKDQSGLDFNVWKAKAAASRGQSPAGQPYTKSARDVVTVSPATPKTAVAAEKPLPTRKITMKMTDVDVAVLLRALARVADQNVMINEKVTGTININITDAPWDEVFRAILRTNGLNYAWEGDIIRIMTLDDLQAELKREAQELDLKRVTPLSTMVVSINYTEAVKLKENLEKLLTVDRDKNPLGSIMVDEHTNSVIIRAIPTDIDKIMPVIRTLDRPTSQVLIEAHIVETGSDTARDLGVQWGALGVGSTDGKNTWIGPGGTNPEGSSLRVDSNNDGVLDQDVEFSMPSGNIINLPADIPGATGMTLGFLYQNVGHFLLSAELQALEEEGKLNILSSPSITTLDNQMAIIESGSRVPIQTVENGEVKIEYQDAVLRLEVTPHVIKDGTLKLKIVTNKDELDFTRTVAGNPTIVTKKAETTVIVFNGQTTVIGGLSRESAQETKSGVPALKDIPGFGWLFKSEGKQKEMEDLLIFITPYVLEEKPAVTESSTRDSAPEDRSSRDQ